MARTSMGDLLGAFAFASDLAFGLQLEDSLRTCYLATRLAEHMVLRIDLTHGRLAQPLLVRVRDEARHARDDEERIAELVVEPEIAANRSNRAVHVHRHCFSIGTRTGVEQPLEHAHQPDVARVELEFHAAEDVQSPGHLRGYVLYYVCEDVDGTCLYRRQDIEVKLPIRR